MRQNYTGSLKKIVENFCRNTPSLSNLSGSLWVLVLSIGGGITTEFSAQAAETISAKYNQLEIELAVTDIEAYANSAIESPIIESLDVLLSEEQRSQVRSALRQEFKIASSVLERFLATPSGDRFLRELAVVVQARSASVDTPAALKTAFTEAAANDGAVTLIGLLKAFPDTGVQVNLEQGIGIFQQIEAQTQTDQASLRELKGQQPRSSDSSPGALAHQLSRPGPFAWDKKSFTVMDNRPARLKVSDQPRAIPFDLYVPRSSSAASVVVISHGLGAGRTSHQYLAEHLSSHGYAVAVPEHSGSSFRHWQKLLEGKTHSIAEPAEFIDRPLDIQHVLDVLTVKNQSDSKLKNRLNLDQVGVFGHSYGGYTALALAGAQLSAQTLASVCNRRLVAIFNPSLLLQCQAAKLPLAIAPLTDSRVTAVFVANPFLSAVFSDLSQIKVPITILASGADQVAPFVPEQVAPYKTIPALTDRSLIVMERATHISHVGNISPQETILDAAKPAAQPVILRSRRALKALGLAFFQSRLGPSRDSPGSLATVLRSLNEPNFPVYGVINHANARVAEATSEDSF